jgi:hypothetical protein
MKSTVILSAMRDRSYYEDSSKLKKFLARQLLGGRLALSLGAGASIGFKLPNWDLLVDRCLRNAGLVRRADRSNESLAEEVLLALGNDELRFAQAVRVALYEGMDLSIKALRENELLSAIGALMMVSQRGNIARVVSFNFDDMLEQYLSYSSFSMESIATIPCWASRADVRVYHPHGLLPSDPSIDVSDKIVFTLMDYDRLRATSRTIWHNLLVDVFSSSTCLFIGLSGDDQNLRSALVEAKDRHAGRKENAFWGIRFSDREDDPHRQMWEHRGVFQHSVTGYGEVPVFLREVCRIAAAMSSA